MIEEYVTCLKTFFWRPCYPLKARNVPKMQKTENLLPLNNFDTPFILRQIHQVVFHPVSILQSINTNTYYTHFVEEFI